MKKLLSLAILVVAPLILTGCGDGNSAGSDAGEPHHIEMISKGFQHDFWQAVYAGARYEAELQGVTISFVGPPSEAHIAEQVQQLAGAINRNPAAIGFAALDTLASMDELQRAINQNIPIIGFDSGVPDAPAGSILANAATNNFQAGELGAENLFLGIQDSLGNERVRIGVLAQDAHGQSIIDRTLGFVETMYQLTSDVVGSENVVVVGHPLYAPGGNEDSALVVIEVVVPAEITDASGMISAQVLFTRDDLIAIFGSNEFSANAIINADQGGNPRLGIDVLGAGFDSGTLQNDAVRSGRFFGSVTQNPFAMGRYTVYLAVLAINGEPVFDVDTGAQWFNAANMDDPDIAILLYE